MISARVLTNKAGVSILEVRTGIFDNTTNTGVPDGSFERIEYTITQNDLGKKPKKIFDRNVTFERSNPTLFSEVINLCQKTDENDPGEGDGHGYDGHGNTDKKPPFCPLQIGKSYSIAIEADLEGVGGVEWNDVEVRDTAVFYNNPEIDLSAEKVQMVLPTGALSDQLLAKVDSGTTYQVQFVNSSTAIGIRATCEVHVFNSVNTDVTPAGRTYRWIPSGKPAYDATKAGSAASDTTTIKPGEQATCEFKMKLAPTGSYRIVVTANAVYPDDYDPSNNKTTGTVTIITADPGFQPPGGFEANVHDYALFGTATDQNGIIIYGDFRGDLAQDAVINGLDSRVVDGSKLTGGFFLTLSFYTVDSTVNQPATATRNLANATWTGDLAALAALASGSVDNCVSSRTSSPSLTTGTFSVDLAKNGNLLTLIICIDPILNSTNYQVAVGVRWTPPNNPPVPIPAANNPVLYGNFLYFDVTLNSTGLGPSFSHAPVQLSESPESATALGATWARVRSH